MFASPHFSFWNVAYTALGAGVLWSTWGYNKTRVFGFSKVIRLFTRGRWCHLVEFAVFIIVGCIVGIGVMDPRTPTQAITAGFAWTGVFIRPDQDALRN